MIQLSVTTSGTAFTPGDLVSGTVSIEWLATEEEQWIDLDVLEVDVEPPAGVGLRTSLRGTLLETVELRNARSVPFSIRLPAHVDGSPDGTWFVTAYARSWAHTATERAAFSVQTPLSRNIGEAVSAVAFSLPILAAGLLFAGFGIAGFPDKLVPEGVRWFAVIAGVCALLAVRALVGRADEGGPLRLLAIPLAVLLWTCGALCTWVVLFQPGYQPFTDVMPDLTLRAAVPVSAMIVDDAQSLSRLAALVFAIIMVPVGTSLITRSKATASQVAELILGSGVIVPMVIALASVAQDLAAGVEPTVPSAPYLLSVIVGAVTLWHTLRVNTWTVLPPALVLSAVAVPLAMGALTVLSEPAIGIVLILWAIVAGYQGVKNVLVRLVSGVVTVAVDATTLRVGGQIQAHVQVQPHSGARVTSIDGVLRCDQTFQTGSAPDRSLEVVTVHTDRRRRSFDGIEAQATVLEHTIAMPIPIGTPPTNTGDAYRSVTWYLEVTVRFRGRPDWVQTFPVTVLA